MANLVVPTVGRNKDVVCYDFRKGHGSFRVLINPDGVEFRCRSFHLRQPTDEELRAQLANVIQDAATHYLTKLRSKDQELTKSVKGFL